MKFPNELDTLGDLDVIRGAGALVFCGSFNHLISMRFHKAPLIADSF